MENNKELSLNNLRYRKTCNALCNGTIYFLSSLSLLPLICIFSYIIYNGFKAWNIDLFTQLPKPVGSDHSGISNAIIGSAEIIAIACVIAIPLGIIIGIYLYEFKKDRLSTYVRLCMDVLQGIPSIVIGIVAYVWIVLPLNSFSSLSGGLALAMMMLPVIARSTEETMNLVPQTYKEAALALGVPYFKTIRKVVLKSARSGISSGIILSIARISGETAPLLFTAFGNQFMSINPLKPINALPLVIFNYATSPFTEWQNIAWGAALFLILFIFILSIGTKLINRHYD